MGMIRGYTRKIGDGGPGEKASESEVLMKRRRVDPPDSGSI